jgi:hypothetical protein
MGLFSEATSRAVRKSKSFSDSLRTLSLITSFIRSSTIWTVFSAMRSSAMFSFLNYRMNPHEYLHIAQYFCSHTIYVLNVVSYSGSAQSSLVRTMFAWFLIASRMG